MQAKEPSGTAMLAAVVRGRHRFTDSPPWVLDDPFALPLVGPTWPQIHASAVAPLRDEVAGRLTASVVLRNRYAEDRLVAHEFRQYVILGAGLDSFAWRRPDMLGTLLVFEVDHPATQAWKASAPRP
jgi:methyltransferase (TIGR00027 family)